MSEEIDEGPGPPKEPEPIAYYVGPGINPPLLEDLHWADMADDLGCFRTRKEAYEYATELSMRTSGTCSVWEVHAKVVAVARAVVKVDLAEVPK